MEGLDPLRTLHGDTIILIVTLWPSRSMLLYYYVLAKETLVETKEFDNAINIKTQWVVIVMLFF